MCDARCTRLDVRLVEFMLLGLRDVATGVSSYLPDSLRKSRLLNADCTINGRVADQEDRNPPWVLLCVILSN